MRREDAAYFADVLKIWFPWLGTDEPAEGADTVQTLCDLYQEMRNESKADPFRPAESLPHDGMMTQELFDKIMEEEG